MKKLFTNLLILITCLITTNVYASFPFLNGNTQQTSLSGMLQNVMPSVVNIAAQGEIILPENPLANPNTPNPNRGGSHQFESLGSGVIVDASNGYVITNAHVLRDAKIINVTLTDGRVFKAKIVGIDPASDIAILQIKADKLKAISMGNSDDLKVGDFVATIGSPFGLNQTVTSGIVSALQRSNLGIEGYENFIQTDAPINVGNSGGALVNLQGQLVGINTAIIGPTGGNIGIGFAIPVNMVRGVMTQLVKYGSVQRGLIGVMVQDFTPALADAFKLPNQTGGALISAVVPNSPAVSAGIQPGDLIQELNNQPIKNAGQLRNAIGMLRVGSRVNVKLLRQGKAISTSMAVADPKMFEQVSEQSSPFLFGVTLQNFDQQLPAQGHVVGVQIMGISENSMAWRAGLRLGDVIVSANLKPVTTFEQLREVAKQSKNQLLLNIYRRGGGAAFVVVK